jgi:protein-S-isoprenylcysteine O-methyltransferase Ste14
MSTPPIAALDARQLRVGILRRAAQVLLTLLVAALCLFVAAGDPAWPRAWLYVGLAVALTLVNFAVVVRRNPEIIVERGRQHRGTKPFDRVFALVFVPLLFAVPIVAGLDAVRFGWAPLPAFLLWPGVLLQVLGGVPICWAMVANRHLEATVRVQRDRDHRVVDSGPYAHVRHPMYLGMLLQYLGQPLLLGSTWALLPVAGVVLAMSARIVLEERTLRAELPGYVEYTARTRFRLLPGLW